MTTTNGSSPDHGAEAPAPPPTLWDRTLDWLGFGAAMGVGDFASASVHNTLTSRVGRGDRPAPARSRRISRTTTTLDAWQAEAVELYRAVGEFRYVAHSQAAVGAQARFYVGKFDAPGDEAPTPVDTGPVAEVWRAFGGGEKSRRALFQRLLVQLFVPGEGLVVGLPPGVLDGTTDPRDVPDDVPLGSLEWHNFSTNEAQVSAGRVTLQVGSNNQSVELPRDIVAVMFRVWRPDPFQYWRADSPAQSAITVLREIVGLTKRVGADIDSRLAGAGILVVSEEAALLSGQVNPSPDPDADDAEVDPVLQALMDAAVTSIQDRDSASAVVPIMLRAPDAKTALEHVTFSTPLDKSTNVLLELAIKRLALSLDAPPEVLLGLGSSTHWNAWIIQDDYIKAHIDPVLQILTSAITEDFLHPVLEAMGVPDWEDYVVWSDSTLLSQRHDRSAEALQLYDRDELSPEALRRESGFDETDAPEVEAANPRDRAIDTAMSMVTQAPSLAQAPGLEALVLQLERVYSGEVREDAEAAPAPAPGGPGPAPAPEEAPEDEGAEEEMPDTREDSETEEAPA